MTPSQLPKETPQPLSEKPLGKVAGDYAELSQTEKEDRTKEGADMEAEIARLEARASEINKSLPGKILATIDREGHTITVRLSELYEKRKQMRSHLH